MHVGPAKWFNASAALILSTGVVISSCTVAEAPKQEEKIEKKPESAGEPGTPEKASEAPKGEDEEKKD